jgi:periplasmic protein CpxP/Spy
MGPGMMGGPGLARVYHSLNLTDTQKQQMRTIVSNARAQFAAQHDGKGGANGKGGAPDMMALANPGDPKYAEAVQAAKKRAADRIQHMSDLKLQLYNVLTPDQKAQLSKKMAEWKARMAQHTEGAKGPPAPANR